MVSVPCEGSAIDHQGYTAYNGKSLGLFLFLSILLTSYLPRVPNETYHNTR